MFRTRVFHGIYVDSAAEPPFLQEPTAFVGPNRAMVLQNEGFPVLTSGSTGNFPRSATNGQKAQPRETVVASVEAELAQW